MILGCSMKYMAGHVKVANNVSGRDLPVYSVDTEEKRGRRLRLMLHGGNESTQKLLDILAKHNVHATFFMTGGWVESIRMMSKRSWRRDMIWEITVRITGNMKSAL